MNRKNIILLAVFLVLLVLAILYRGPWSARQAEQQRELSFLSGLDLEKIDKLEIKQPGKAEVLLIKEQIMGREGVIGETRWKIADTGFYVNQNEIDEIFLKIQEISRQRLILASNDKERKTRFQTDNEQGIWVNFLGQNDILGSMIIGRNSRDYNYTYISEAGIDQTYMIPGNVYGLFVRSDWRDMTIFKDQTGNKERINKIRIQRGAENLIMEKINNVWKQGITELDSEKIQKIIDVMFSLTADRLPEQTFANTGLEKNSLIVQVLGENVDSTLMIGDFLEETQDNPDGKKNVTRYYYAKTGQSDNIYLISEKIVKDLQADLKK